MISSASSPDRPSRPDVVANTGSSAGRPYAPRPDQISTQSAEFLRAQLQSQPEIRPEVVARGRELAADPQYPPVDILREIAGGVMRAPDLSESDS